MELRVTTRTTTLLKNFRFGKQDNGVRSRTIRTWQVYLAKRKRTFWITSSMQHTFVKANHFTLDCGQQPTTLPGSGCAMNLITTQTGFMEKNHHSLQAERARNALFTMTLINGWSKLGVEWNDSLFANSNNHSSSNNNKQTQQRQRPQQQQQQVRDWKNNLHKYSKSIAPPLRFLFEEQEPKKVTSRWVCVRIYYRILPPFWK